MDKKAGPVIAAMLEQVEAIEAWTQGKSFDDFCAERLLRQAVQRAIEIISEASRRLRDDLKAQHPEINWEAVRSIGNVLRLEYENVQDEAIWLVVTDHIAPLKTALLGMKGQLNRCL